MTTAELPTLAADLQRLFALLRRLCFSTPAAELPLAWRLLELRTEHVRVILSADPLRYVRAGASLFECMVRSGAVCG